MAKDFKRVEPGRYEGRPFFGLKAVIANTEEGWKFKLVKPGRKGFAGNPHLPGSGIDSTPDEWVMGGTARTLAAAKMEIYDYGRNTKTTVKNLMSGGDVEMSIDMVGGPCDPSTERYWSM